jgi:hypothetical protein
MVFKKSITEADLLAFLEEGRLQLPPLQVAAVERKPRLGPDSKGIQPDALLTLRWRDRNYCFVVETRRLWTPLAVAEAVDQVRRYVSLANTALADKTAGERIYPLIVVPYLGEERLLALEAQGVSGIDLCGNGAVVVPDELLILRTGLPNRFRWEGTIKNVYRKNSSIVARVFLLVPKFNSVKAVLEEIQQRGGKVTLATVSKVCKNLQDDLVIERSRRKPSPRRQGEPPRAESFLEPALRLLQAEKLLDLLADNYAQPAVSRSFQGKCALASKELRIRLAGWEAGSSRRAVLTGASSTEAYAVMAREPVQSFYCSDLDSIVRSLGDDIRETERFANVTFLETRDDFVYFDRRPGLVASPIQTYLELLAGDKRERETADQVRRVILGPLAQAGQKG